MRVLVTGAYGLIGGYVAARLLRDGHEIVGTGRDIVRARRRMPRVRWVRADFAAMDVDAWAAVVAGVDAVVNCTGALQDSPRDDLHATHVSGVKNLARACEMAGVRRFIQISAAGVASGQNPFRRSKRDGDAIVAECKLDWVVLRPGLVLAPVAYGGSALLRGLAAFPAIVPAVHANSVVQVVSVEDVAEAVARAIAPDAPARITCDLAAPELTFLAEILVALRAWLGIAPARLLELPPAAGAVTACAADALAWLGWRSPMRRTAMRQLADGVRARADDAPRLLGVTPRSLAQMLDGWPSGVQERWFARLYFVKPLAFATLALFWGASGLIGFLNRDAAALVLTRAGSSQSFAMALVEGGAAVDVAIGLLLCARRTARIALIGALLVTVVYLAGATVLRPDLWSDPLGPLVKTLPAAALAIVALGMIDER